MKKVNEMHWYHSIVLPDGSITPGSLESTEDEFNNKWGIPTSLKGKRVLDVGCADGLFAFECEKRGAKSVFAIDNLKNSKNSEYPEMPFYFAKAALNSNVDFKQMDLIEMNSYIYIGLFDLVLLYGVLEYLENPLKGLENACGVIAPSGKILIETAVLNNTSEIPQIDFSNGQYIPNVAWLKRELTRLGFNTVIVIYEKNWRVTIKGEK